MPGAHCRRSLRSFTDLTGLERISLKIGHIFEVVKRRREDTVGLSSVKCAIFSDTVVGFGIARLYESLMEGGPIEVRPFRTREEAAQWFGVPLEVLSPDYP